MNGREHIVAHQTLRKYDSIFIVITFPRHISHQKITTQCKFAILRSITFSQNIALFHALSLATNRPKIDGHILISATELRNAILFHCRFEADKLLIFCTIIENTNGCRIDIVNNSWAFGCNHCTRIFANLFLQTSTYNRRIVMKQRNSLPHHITSHQCTVTIIVLQEWNQCSRHRSNLLRGHIHQVYLCRLYNREIGILATFHVTTNESTIPIQRCITLADDMIFLFFCSEINYIFVLQINNTIGNLTIWGLDKT